MPESIKDEDSNTLKIATPFGDCSVPINQKEIRSFVRSVMREAEEQITLFDDEAIDFFGVTSVSEIESEYEWWEEKEVPARLHDLMSFIEENYEIVHSRAYSRRKNCHSSISYRQFEYPSGNQSQPIKATFFVKDKNNVRYIVDVCPVDGLNIELQVSFDPSISSMSDFIQPYTEYFKSKGVLKNAKFDANMGFITTEKTAWEDIVLTEEQRNLLERNIVRYIENISLYKEKGLPTSRGCLITGPPGTGKTLCCKTLMSQVNCTFIYITSDHIDNRGQIAALYELARSLSPTIVVVEDIDTLGAVDRQQMPGDHPLLGEFLNCLAGVEQNNNVITVATTNYPKHLDRALIDRPGRFDLRLDFDLPDEKLRKTIFERYLKEIKHGKVNYKKLVAITVGMTGAHLKEIVMLAYTRALEENGYSSSVKVGNKKLIAAAETLAKNREKYQYHVGKSDKISSMHI